MPTGDRATSDAPDAPQRVVGGRSDLQLVVFCGDELRTYELPTAGVITIGRAEDNFVRIDDSSVSRQHALLHLGASISIEDLGGQNGTFLRDKTRPGSLETLSLRQLVRRRADVTVGDSITVGAASIMLRHAPKQQIPRLSAAGEASGVVVRSAALEAVYEQAALAARSNISLLLLGETGVGKDVLARAVHSHSRRAEAPFMSINCAALSESLLESELFGCEKGAFTGALQARAGLFEAASPGTVFLDEVGELSLPTQAKLLRVLEDRTVLRVGSTKPRAIDVRFIAATNRDLEAEVPRGSFRSDLYFRLNGVSFVIPPLRERREEIEPLVKTFLAAADGELERVTRLEISEQALTALRQYTWPGNVRELRNVIERAAVLCTADTVLLEHLPAAIARRSPSPPAAPVKVSPLQPSPAATADDEKARLQAELRAVERARIEQALAACGGNQTRAAEVLGVSRRTLVSRVAEFGLGRTRGGGKPPSG